MEEVVQGSGLAWTIARPPRLTQADDAHYRDRDNAQPPRGFRIARKAVAAFMLDSIEQNTHIHQIVGVAK
jgi:hypothetical protein